MKLRTVTAREEANYPSFDSYHANRRSFMKTLAIGVGGMAVAGAGCDSTAAEALARLPGEVRAPREPVELEGDVAVAVPPKKPAELRGSVPVPEEPRKKGELAAPTPPKKGDGKETRPALKGKLRAPAPPPKPGGKEPVPIPGNMPKPVDPSKRPQIMGRVRAVEPVRLRGQVPRPGTIKPKAK